MLNLGFVKQRWDSSSAMKTHPEGSLSLERHVRHLPFTFWRTIVGGSMKTPRSPVEKTGIFPDVPSQDRPKYPRRKRVKGSVLCFWTLGWENWSGGGYAHANTFYTHLSMVKNMFKKRESWSKRGPFFVVAAWWRGVVVRRKLHQLER